MEDCCQLAEKLTAGKDKGSMELVSRLAGAIPYPTNPYRSINSPRFSGNRTRPY